MHKLALVLGTVILSTSISSYAASEVKVRGELTQGALLIGEAPAGSQVTLNGEKLSQTADGEFVFGFGRDAKLQHKLVVVTATGERIEKVLQLTPREYQIDRVEGVPQETVTPDPEQVARAKKDAEQVWLARQQHSTRDDFLTPVIAPAHGRISGVYGSQRYFNGEPRRPHYGQDIAAPVGAAVVAPWPGKVVLAVPDMFYSGGTLIIEHGYGVTTTYLHLSHILVKVGERVEQGDDIAEVGATGRATGPHLDWRVNWGQERLDPALLPSLYQPSTSTH
ncbi:M23 family metallopeptidase [Idiomarina xiamenensis]|uniref:M23/M37 family peptidase n=1 Tax=Idiomarina xiamenensis 10-D-4 TaxID=740709 RepID=K2KX17_9GAMM|nr:M23 family metallopeptidase [Idiomarina xiamenensis]EKE87049.1 M23/M37 family peptidase [Idiomarina xiamenensis 10-D-4]